MSTEEQQSKRVDWVIYGCIVIGTLVAVLIITASLMGALVASCGAVLSATHAAAMMRRAYHPASTADGDA